MIETLAWVCVYGAGVLFLLLVTGCLPGLERWAEAVLLAIGPVRRRARKQIAPRLTYYVGQGK